MGKIQLLMLSAVWHLTASGGGGDKGIPSFVVLVRTFIVTVSFINNFSFSYSNFIFSNSS